LGELSGRCGGIPRSRHFTRQRLKSPPPLPGFGEEHEMFEITPPARVTLIISVVLAVFAVIIRLAHIELPVFPTHGFVMLLVGYVVLLAGNLVRGM
jgi:hypothetical protein